MTSVKVKGHLEILDRGFGFLRDIEKNFVPGPKDTFVPAHLIRKFDLQEGLFIEGAGVKGEPNNSNYKLASIEHLNQEPFTEGMQIESLHRQTSINPTEKLNLVLAPDDLMGQALDLIVPIGKGQRGLIIAPPKSGKTTILKHIAKAAIGNHPDTKVYVLLVDERPEEVTDFRRDLSQARVLYSSADQSISQHMRMTRLALNTAIRTTEMGADAVVVIDSLTRMSRAFNVETQSYGRTMTGGLGANALEIPRKIFGAARNLEKGGSLTIIATILVETGSRMDDIIYQEFKGTGNMDLVLNRKCAEQRLWPAIDVNSSGTRKEELLLDKKAYKESLKLRRALAGKDEVSALEGLLTYLGNREAFA